MKFLTYLPVSRSLLSLRMDLSIRRKVDRSGEMVLRASQSRANLPSVAGGQVLWEAVRRNALEVHGGRETVG
jgi:hypothetical protein